MRGQEVGGGSIHGSAKLSYSDDLHADGRRRCGIHNVDTHLQWVCNMNIGRMPFLTLRGDPYSRGRQHGEALSTAIHASLSRLKRSSPNGAWSRAERLAGHSWLQLEDLAPDIAAEIKGIAEGSEISLLYAYLLSGFEFLDTTPPGGCTTVAVTDGKEAVVAQNWDAPPGTEQELAMLLHQDKDYGVAMVASPGTLGWVGMNWAGLALVTNDLIVDTARQGIPSLVVRRLLLQERDVSGVLARLRVADHLSGRCYLFGDANGHVAGCEISPLIGCVPLTGNQIVHTNHPITPPIAIMEDIEAVARIYPSSRERLRSANSPSLEGIADIHRLLRNTTGAPDAICKTASEREPTQTAFSVVFECRDRRASICLGRPDRGVYHAFDFAHESVV